MHLLEQQHNRSQENLFFCASQESNWCCTHTTDTVYRTNRLVHASSLVLQNLLPTRFLSTYSLHLLQHSVFDFDVFKNGLDDHVGFFEAAVVQRARQVGQDGVPLKCCDALLFCFVIEPDYR